MATDGLLLSQIKKEILEVSAGARVDKIHQPARDEIIIALRTKNGTRKLLLSASAQNPRVHFTEIAPENPKSPPMFCMLLRKHIGSARLTDITQPGLERVLNFHFSGQNEFGDPETVILTAEIMGRHSNIVLVGADGRIIDSVKRVDPLMSSVRPILPGMPYTPPPAQPGKLNLSRETVSEILEAVEQKNGKSLAKALQDTLAGFSPLICRETAFRATGETDSSVGEMSEGQKRALAEVLSEFADKLADGGFVPTMLVENGSPVDFAPLPILQYGDARVSEPRESFGSLPDDYYRKKDTATRMAVRASDLLRTLGSASDRITRKLSAQQTELLESENRDRFKVFGDLLSSSAHLIEKGMSHIKIANYYDPDYVEVDIPLDIMLSPSANIQKYYGDYRRAKTAGEMLAKLIVKGEKELEYIESVLDLLARAASESELAAIREELEQTGYARRSPAKKAKPEKLSPIKYISDEGFTILVGRNNMQNDRLTLKESSKEDIWLHTQNIPGSHTVILTDGKIPGNTTVEQAAALCAYHSKARDSGKVPVDYTKIRYVKKPAGAAPGKVIYTDFQTAVVTPDENLVERLRSK